MSLASIFQSEKSIAAFPGWSEPEQGSSCVWFDAPLEIGGVVEPGLVLHGAALLDFPDCNTSFEIVVRSLKSRKRIPLARVDWRALRGGHTNPRRAGIGDLSGKRVGHSHFHCFELNYVEAEQRMRTRNLPIARTINEKLQSFDSLRDFCGKEFKINNIDIVKPPKWVYDLLYEPAVWDDQG